MSATRAVNSLTDDDMKLRSAVGANRIVRAQLKAETFSGNSESTGAIHWMEKNTAPDPKRGTRRETAMVLIDSTKASVTKTKVRAAKTNSPTIAASLRTRGFTSISARGGPSRTSSGPFWSVGSRKRSHMYPTKAAPRINESRSDISPRTMTNT